MHEPFRRPGRALVPIVQDRVNWAGGGFWAGEIGMVGVDRFLLALDWSIDAQGPARVDRATPGSGNARDRTSKGSADRRCRILAMRKRTRWPAQVGSGRSADTYRSPSKGVAWSARPL